MEAWLGIPVREPLILRRCLWGRGSRHAPDAAQRVALRGAVRCRAGAVTSAGVWYGPGSAERHEECRTASGTRFSAHVILLAEVVADLDQHRDAFGIAGSGDGRLTGLGAEFPGVAVTKPRDHDALGAVEMRLQLRSCHRNEFGFGLDGLAHDGGFPAGAIDRCRLPFR